jgi:hypothetical protein
MLFLKTLARPAMAEAPHAWPNMTKKKNNSSVLRVFFVFQPTEQVQLEGGKVVGQDLDLSLREA